MTTVTMETGTASSAILFNDLNDEKFSYPTLEPGFDLLSDDWFQQKNLNLSVAAAAKNVADANLNDVIIQDPDQLVCWGKKFKIQLVLILVVLFFWRYVKEMGNALFTAKLKNSVASNPVCIFGVDDF